jgi:hypothetical protein
MNFECGVTAKWLVLRLHRTRKSSIGLNITKIWQLRRIKDKPNWQQLETLIEPKKFV